MTAIAMFKRCKCTKACSHPYTAVVDLPKQRAQRCEQCKEWHTVDRTPVERCPTCGGELGEPKLRRHRKWYADVAGVKYTNKGKMATALEQLLADPRRRKALTGSAITVDEYMRRWLAHWATQVRPVTHARYTTLINKHVVPVIGDYKMTDVEPEHVVQVLDKMERAGLSPMTRVQVHAVIGKAFATAIEWRIISTNPVRDAKRPKVRPLDPTLPSNEQLLSALDGAGGTSWEMPLLLAITTGARRSEVLAIRWSDIDLDKRRVRITQSLQQLRNEVYFAPLKTESARREIALPVFAIDRIRNHRKARAARRLLLGEHWQAGDLVCEDGGGAPLHPDSFSQWYRREAQKLGFPTLRLHDVRHRFATTLLERGVHPNIVSAMLGHSDPAFTMRVYQHVMPNMTETAADAMDAALSPEVVAEWLQTGDAQ